MQQERHTQPRVLSRFDEAVQTDVQGHASDEQAELLQSQLRDWLDALVLLKRTVELQFSRRRAELETFRQECLQKGPSGKSAFFTKKAEHDEWRAKAMGYASAVERRLKHVRRLSDEAPETQDDLTDLCVRAKEIINDLEEQDLDVREWMNDYDRLVLKAS
jgi:hypothetical protein